MFAYIAQDLFLIPQYLDEIVENFSEELPKLLNKLCFMDETVGPNKTSNRLIFVLFGSLIKRRPDLQE